MRKRLDRFISVENYHAPDDELRELCKERICIWYSFNNYERSMKHIHELCETVRSEYPDMQDEDMEVRFIERALSHRHEGRTTLRVAIPIEDFLKLRREGKIDIL